MYSHMHRYPKVQMRMRTHHRHHTQSSELSLRVASMCQVKRSTNTKRKHICSHLKCMHRCMYKCMWISGMFRAKCAAPKNNVLWKFEVILGRQMSSIVRVNYLKACLFILAAIVVTSRVDRDICTAIYIYTHHFRCAPLHTPA